MIQNSTILVTGGLGAIGSNLCKELLQRDCEKLIILDDCSSSFPELNPELLANEKVEFVKGSVVDGTLLHQVFFYQPSIVLHLAAHFANQNSVEHPLDDCMVNSIGTLKVLELSLKHSVEKLLFASSSCVYGSEGNFGIESHSMHLDTPYAINKLHGEYLVKFFHDYHKLNTTTLRYFNSFGPGELPGKYRNVIPNFFALAMQGKALPITGDDTISRDFNYIGNTIDATIAAIESPVSNGKVYNVGSGKETRICVLAETINDIVGNSAGIEYHPSRSWDTIKHRSADISRTMEDLHYRPVADLPAQLTKTYDWIKSVQEHIPAL